MSERFNERSIAIRPVRVWDLLPITRLVYANMTGIDAQVTRFAENLLLRLAGYVVFPLYLATSGRGFKAVVDGTLAGCAFLYVRPLSALVFNVNVIRPYRRRGVGRQLMLHLEAEARATPVHWLALQVDADNVPARSLYRQLGYEPYHPRFLHRPGGDAITQPVAPGVALERLRRRDGTQLFGRFSGRERSAGDAWAARVVKREYDDGPPGGGRFYRCLLHGREVGCLWLGGSGARPVVSLRLAPEQWGQATLTVSLLRLALERVDGTPEQIDVHVGSSRHHDAIAPILRPLGFAPQDRPQLLMLKRVGE